MPGKSQSEVIAQPAIPHVRRVAYPTIVTTGPKRLRIGHQGRLREFVVGRGDGGGVGDTVVREEVVGR